MILVCLSIAGVATAIARLPARDSDDSREPCVVAQAAAMDSEGASEVLDLVATSVREVDRLPTGSEATAVVVVPKETMSFRYHWMTWIRTSESFACHCVVLDHYWVEEEVVPCNHSNYWEVHSEDLH
jgi:hypothetical protein